MKTKRTGILMTLLFAAGLMLNTACTPTEANEKEQPKVEDKSSETSTDVDKSSKEYTSMYVCPMHCEGSGSDAPGKCPICNMDYVVNENAVEKYEQDGHQHDEHDHGGHDHDGHDHGHEGHDHG